MNIGIMRAFVRLRELASLSRDLTRKLAELERRIGNHDENIEAIFQAIRSLMEGPEKPPLKIGFGVDKR